MMTRTELLQLRLTGNEKEQVQRAMETAAREIDNGKPRSRPADALRIALLKWSEDILHKNA